jgi:hypothetical protein
MYTESFIFKTPVYYYNILKTTIYNIICLKLIYMQIKKKSSFNYYTKIIHDNMFIARNLDF